MTRRIAGTTTSQSRRGQLVARSLQDEQLGAGDLARQRLAVAEREDRVLGAVDDERRHVEPAEALAPAVASLGGVVVLHARLDVRRAIDDARAERARALARRTGASGSRERARDARSGSRSPPRGPTSRARRSRPKAARASSVMRRQVGLAGPAGLVAMSVSEATRSGWSSAMQLGERAAHRLPDDVRPAPRRATSSSADGVGDEVIARVARRARRVAGRLARVAVVVADDVARPRREARAEVVLPPVHRGARSHDEQDRRVGRARRSVSTQRSTPLAWTIVGSIG